MSMRVASVTTAVFFLVLEVAWCEVEPRFDAPGDAAELAKRVADLRAAYAPFLRSLPPKLPAKNRVSLNGQWRFAFEVKDPPRDTKAVPPAPPWYTVDFDDSPWETTTVPEWRYRTRGHDNA
ncbi:MAG TPA: hypothetical protein EYP14_06680, partial [Planctomycetaceae bacterium]|nr:hypothetical protein [Planctomycetaceae bacterium]